VLGWLLWRIIRGKIEYNMNIFLSSTIRDLKEVRVQLKKFIDSMGYTSIQSELGDILYDPNEHTHLSCIESVTECDMLIIIIGGRLGGESHKSVIANLDFELLASKSIDNKLLEEQSVSITQAEVLKAIESNIPIYTFIEKGVYYDHYIHGLNGTIPKYTSIEKENTEQYIFNLINFIRFQDKNNAIWEFDIVDDIIINLKNQWSMYFQKLIQKQKLSNVMEIDYDITKPCAADWTISERKSSQIVQVESDDTSNLFFLFLAVRDCKDSRETVAALRAKKFPHIKLEAMYDLMGSWDLVIKFRVNKEVKKFKKEIISNLLNKHMIDKGKNKTFGRRKLINVTTQSKSILGLIEKNSEEKIYYTLLPNDQAYDDYRSSRAFIYIQLDAEYNQHREAFLNRLNRSITGAYGSKIIESICESCTALIIETFSRCSQSNAINHLNKAIEATLSSYGLQKYTLMCYYYDEIELLNNPKGNLS
jgi:DNA-binding MarR family transcriptional regulator